MIKTTFERMSDIVSANTIIINDEILIAINRAIIEQNIDKTLVMKCLLEVEKCKTKFVLPAFLLERALIWDTVAMTCEMTSELKEYKRKKTQIIISNLPFTLHSFQVYDPIEDENMNAYVRIKFILKKNDKK